MSMPLRQRIHEHATELLPFLIDVRRDLHAHPELGNVEHRTAARIVAALQPLGLEVETDVGGTGVVAVLHGAHPGRTIALRADMDALPIDEHSDRPFRSCTPGVMHACGHDGHVAMALGAARVLHDLRPQLHGAVKFLFQPAEETYGGASELIAAGCLTGAPAVDAVFGLHLEPLGDVGELRLRSGPLMASSDALRLTIIGKGGHASEPHTAVDPVTAAAHVLTALQTMVTRRFDVKTPVVISITYLQGGAAFNVIPDEVVLAGTVRAVDPAVRAQLPKAIELVATHTAAAFGASAELAYVPGSSVVVNDAGFTDFVRRSVAGEPALAQVVELPHAVMAAEDFGAYLERVPGTFAFLGARPAHQTAYPCHHPQFDFDEAALPRGVAILATVAAEYLSAAAVP